MGYSTYLAIQSDYIYNEFGGDSNSQIQLYVSDQSHIRGAFNMDDKHSHKPHEIYYLRKGQRYYFIDDRIYHVHQGDLIFVPSFVLHRTTAADNRDHERTVVYFQDRFLEDLIPDIVAHPIMNRFYSEPKVVRLKLADQIVVENILSKLSLEYQNRSPIPSCT